MVVDTFEYPCHRVVIPGGDRVELVVVTTCAGDRLCQEAFSDDVELFIDNIHVELFLVLVFQERITHHQKRRGDQVPSSCVNGRCLEQIARELLRHKLVKRQVGIERFNHVVAITPSVLEYFPTQRHRLGETRHIQPVPPPPFTEAR